MLIRIGCELAFDFPRPASMVLMVFLHPSRLSDVRRPEQLTLTPAVRLAESIDSYGNRCGRIKVSGGRQTIRMEAVVDDCGLTDIQCVSAPQHEVEDLPFETLLFLLPSRYCEVDSELKDLSWTLFGHIRPGWPRVQAICDLVQRHIRFDYALARNTRTALDAYRERVGVCRDFMHLAITFCRCLNIPARYCTGYLGDIGVPLVPSPMDFSAWFEAYVGGQWYAFDARNNVPRTVRVSADLQRQRKTIMWPKSPTAQTPRATRAWRFVLFSRRCLMRRHQTSPKR